MKELWDRNNQPKEKAGVSVPVVVDGEDKQWWFDSLGHFCRELSGKSFGPRYHLHRIEHEGEQIVLRFKETKA